MTRLQPTAIPFPPDTSTQKQNSSQSQPSNDSRAAMTNKGTKNHHSSTRSAGQPGTTKQRNPPTDRNTKKKKNKMSNEVKKLKYPYGDPNDKKKPKPKESSRKEPAQNDPRRHDDPRRQTNGKENNYPDNTDGNLLNADLVQSPTEPNKDAEDYEDDLFNDEEEDTPPSKQVFNDNNLDKEEDDDESGDEEGQQNNNNNDDEDDEDDDDDEMQDDETLDDDEHPEQTGGNQGTDYGQIRIPDNARGSAIVSDMSTLEKSVLDHLQKNGVVDSKQTVISEVKSVARDKAWKHFKVLNTVDLEHNSPFARFCLFELRLLPPKTDTILQKKNWAGVKKYLVDGISQARSAATQKIQKNFIELHGRNELPALAEMEKGRSNKEVFAVFAQHFASGCLKTTNWKGSIEERKYSEVVNTSDETMAFLILKNNWDVWLAMIEKKQNMREVMSDKNINVKQKFMKKEGRGFSFNTDGRRYFAQMFQFIKEDRAKHQLAFDNYINELVNMDSDGKTKKRKKKIEEEEEVWCPHEFDGLPEECDQQDAAVAMVSMNTGYPNKRPAGIYCNQQEKDCNGEPIYRDGNGNIINSMAM